MHCNGTVEAHVLWFLVRAPFAIICLSFNQNVINLPFNKYMWTANMEADLCPLRHAHRVKPHPSLIKAFLTLSSGSWHHKCLSLDFIVNYICVSLLKKEGLLCLSLWQCLAECRSRYWMESSSSTTLQQWSFTLRLTQTITINHQSPLQ